jgi:hypothetical protein
LAIFPRILAFAKSMNHEVLMGIGVPLLIIRLTPVRIDIVPKVVKKEGIFPITQIKPFNNPTRRPTNGPIIRTNIPTFPSKRAATTPARVTVAPTERSMLPIKITKLDAKEIINNIDDCLSKVEKFVLETKRGFKDPKIINKIMRKNNGAIVLKLINLFLLNSR